MRICYLCPDLGITVDGQKGASVHIRGFINALVNLGHEVFVLTSCPALKSAVKAPITVIPGPETVAGIPERDDPKTFLALRHLLYNASVEGILRETIQSKKPDLIYERYSPFSAAGSIMSRRMGIPHVLEVNALLAEQGKLYRKQALQEASELMEKASLRNSGMMVTVSEELKELIVSRGYPEEKVKVIPCGVDEHLFRCGGESYKPRFPDKIVLGFVGSLKPWHDIELLARVFRKLAPNPLYHLLVVGDGPLRKTIRALSQEFPGRVTATGAVEQEEVPKYIRAMDIGLAPYPEKDFYHSPLKVFEYMAAGRAVVATGIGQLNHLVQHHVTGFLVPPGCDEEWIKAIEALRVDHHSIERMGRAASEEIRKKHTWDNRAESFVAMVKEYSHWGDRINEREDVL